MKKLVSGSIIEVNIKSIKSYIYMKYVDVRDFTKEVSYPFEFRIHYSFNTNPLHEVSELDFSDLLISPLHLTGFKELIKLGEWELVGFQDLTKYDKEQHYYKMAWPPNLMALVENVKQWRVLKNINNVNKGEIVPYELCSHLEYAENLGASHLSLRIMVEYYKIKKKKINFDKSIWDEFDRILLNRYIHMPAYVTIPDKFKGKLLLPIVQA